MVRPQRPGEGQGGGESSPPLSGLGFPAGDDVVVENRGRRRIEAPNPDWARGCKGGRCARTDLCMTASAMAVARRWARPAAAAAGASAVVVADESSSTEMRRLTIGLPFVLACAAKKIPTGATLASLPAGAEPGGAKRTHCPASADAPPPSP
eukprot:scaffold5816_cov69-Isochrysis_galbana.AAC.2